MKQSDIIESNLGTYRWCNNTREFVTKDDALSAINSIQNYEGWGRCRKIIDPNSEEYKCAVDFLKSYGHKRIEIKDILSKVQSSTLTSFYTPTDVAKTITEYALQAYDKLNGRHAQTLLDPSCGTGAFLTGLEWNDTLKYVECCEKDEITNTILKVRTKAMNKLAKYHGKDIEFSVNYSYENINRDWCFDIITSNIPFGDVSVYDKHLDKMGGVYKASQKKIHNYYFMKSLHLLNDGGIMAFITSRGFLSSEKNKQFRDEMLKYGRIITIVRLPDNLFHTVDVGSDLIVYQKTNEFVAKDENHRLQRIFLNGWSEEIHNSMGNEHIISNCEITRKKNQYGKQVQHYKYIDTDLATDLKQYLQGINQNEKALRYGNHFFFFFDKFENNK